MTSSGIEPATFQLVAHCHYQLRHHVPLNIFISIINYTYVMITFYHKRSVNNSFYISTEILRKEFILCFVQIIFLETEAASFYESLIPTY